MTTALLDRVPVDQIAEQARQVRFWRTVLTVLLGVLFGVGWVSARAWLGIAFCGCAVREGWREGRRVNRGAG